MWSHFEPERAAPRERFRLVEGHPATGELVGTVETIKPEDVQGVVDDVAEVQPFWGQLSLADRARYLRRAADVLVEEVDEVAELLTREQGKPITESYTMEVRRASRWYSFSEMVVRAQYVFRRV